MNLFLLEQADEHVEWSREDPRTIHLKKVLKAKNGDRVDFGVVNGSRGKGSVGWMDSGAVHISLKWSTAHSSDMLPVSLLVGLSRPQTCRKIIEQAAALGVQELIFFHADKGESSYGESTLWQDEWYRLLKKGAEQAFSCHLPSCVKVDHLDLALASVQSNPAIRLALDIYEAPRSLSSVRLPKGQGVLLAIGPERGWSDKERKTLRGHGFDLCHLGKRILRVETAMVASVGYLSANSWSELGGCGA